MILRIIPKFLLIVENSNFLMRKEIFVEITIHKMHLLNRWYSIAKNVCNFTYSSKCGHSLWFESYEEEVQLDLHSFATH